MYPGAASKLAPSTVTAAASIQVKTDLVWVEGSTTISTILPPLNGGFPTVLFLVPVDANTATTTTGNISIAVTMPVGRVTVLVYDNVLDTWYPGAIS